MTSEFDHLSSRTIERYRRRELPPAQLLAVDDHIAACPACREQLAAGESSPAAGAAQSFEAELSRAGEEPFHLPYELLAAYVDDQADPVDREIAEGHLEGCAQCAAELADLRSFRALMTTYPPQEHSQAEAPSLGSRLREVWRRRPALVLGPLAGAAAAAVLAVGLLHGRMPGPAPVPGGGTEVALNDAPGRITVDANGNLTGLPGLSPKMTREVAGALKSGDLAAPDALQELAGTRPGGNPSFAVRGPASTVVRSTEPEFRWDLPAGATGCRIRLVGVSSKLDKTSKMQPRGKDRWKPKKGVLRRGETYGWQVVAFNGADQPLVAEPSDPSAVRFKVLDAESLRRVEEGEKQLNGSHLALGVLYTREGLLDDAAQQFQELRKQNPGSPAADRLLYRVKSLRPIGAPSAAGASAEAAA